jgi:hypothetical protein
MRCRGGGLLVSIWDCKKPVSIVSFPCLVNDAHAEPAPFESGSVNRREPRTPVRQRAPLARSVLADPGSWRISRGIRTAREPCVTGDGQSDEEPAEYSPSP